MSQHTTKNRRWPPQQHMTLCLRRCTSIPQRIETAVRRMRDILLQEVLVEHTRTCAEEHSARSLRLTARSHTRASARTVAESQSCFRSLCRLVSSMCKHQGRKIVGRQHQRGILDIRTVGRIQITARLPGHTLRLRVFAVHKRTRPVVLQVCTQLLYFCRHRPFYVFLSPSLELKR